MSGKEKLRRARQAIELGVLEAVELGPARVSSQLPGGLGGQHEAATIVLMPAESSITSNLDGSLRCVSSAGDPLGSIPLTFSKRATGVKGGRLWGHDPSQFFSVELAVTLDGTFGEATVHTERPDRCHPLLLLPTLECIRATADHPNSTLELEISGTTVARMKSDLREAVQDFEGLENFVRQLVTIQDATKTLLMIPKEIGNGDADSVEVTVELLAGESIDLAVRPITIELAADDNFRDGETVPQLLFLFHHRVRIFDKEVSLGNAHAAGGPWSVDLDPSASTATLSPTDASTMTLRLGVPPGVTGEIPDRRVRVIKPGQLDDVPSTRVP